MKRVIPALVVWLGIAPVVRGQAASAPAAVERGLAFLAKMQKSDGSFEATGPGAAMAGLGLLAFLSAGHVPETGRHGLVVRNAVEYLVNLNPEGGYYGKDAGGRGMYVQAVVTTALAQVYGVEADERQRQKVRTALERALAVIYTAQDVKKDEANAGGWRYEPTSTDSDLSVTGWCVLALMAAEDAGIDVPAERLERAAAYMLRCYKGQARAFGYRAEEEASPGVTGIAVLAMHLMGRGSGPEVSGAGRFLSQRLVVPANPHYPSALYFTVAGARRLGDAPGREVWTPVWKSASEQLLSSQRKDDGSWTKSRDEATGSGPPARFYSTAMACLTLSVPAGILPVYQK